MKYLYLVDYWVPFPSSEYGGVVSVIAENDSECYDVLLKWRDEYEHSHDARIMERVVNAHKFALVDEESSRVVDSFTT
jgi:hypothetical protein